MGLPPDAAIYIARVSVAARHRGVYDYSDYHSAARVCAALPAGAVPTVLECARVGWDRLLDLAALGVATQRVLTELACCRRCGAYLPPPALLQQKRNL